MTPYKGIKIDLLSMKCHIAHEISFEIEIDISQIYSI